MVKRKRTGARRAAHKGLRRTLLSRFFARLLFGANTLLAFALALLLLGMVNYVANQQFRRFDLSATRFFSLSDKTLQLLNGVTNRLDVYVLLPSDHTLYDDVTTLLREYRYACPPLVVETVDPNRDLARAELIAREVEGARPAVVVFSYEGRSEIVDARNLVESELDPDGVGMRRVSFRGEVEFSSAIRRVIAETRPTVYMLRGHGERDINNFDPARGYSQIARALRRDHINIQPFLLGEQLGLPDDCDLLIIAGPTRRFAQPELDIIRTYLERSGRLLVLLDALHQVGIETVLEDWGIRLPNEIVVDSQHTLTGRELIAQDYGPHPITRRLQNVITLFHLPRPVDPAVEPALPGVPPTDGTRVIPLVFSSELSWAESDPTQTPFRFDPGVDRPGPIPIAVTVERGVAAELAAEISPTRIVVFGDSDFASNGALTGGNTDLFLSAVNWLLEREEMMGIDAKTYQEYRLLMSRDQLKYLFWAVVVALPAGVSVIGILVGIRRRK